MVIQSLKLLLTFTKLIKTFGPSSNSVASLDILIFEIDFINSSEYNDYDPMILIKDPTYEELAERLNQLLKEPYDSYLERAKEYSSYVMNYKPDLPPHIRIRRKIEEYL